MDLFIANSFRAETFHLDRIEENVIARGNETMVIEERMQRSVAMKMAEVGVTRETARAARLPSIESRLQDLEYLPEFYNGAYRIGSHAIHGSWSSLRSQYLNAEVAECGKAIFTPCEGPLLVRADEFDGVALVVLDAIVSFFGYVARDPSALVELFSPLRTARETIWELQKIYTAGDWDIVP